MDKSKLALAGMVFLASLTNSVVAQTGTNKNSSAEVVAIWSDRQQMPGYAREKQALQESLEVVSTVDLLNRAIADRGYLVTAINEQSGDRVEYEIAKANRSYEIAAELATSGAVSSVFVSSNIYPALSTRKALADNNYRVDALIYDKSTGALYSDSRYLKAWNSDKEMLRDRLTKGMALSDYESQLSALGYKITSINDLEEDYVEFEVVKGDQSYEVQLDLVEGGRMVSNVEIDSNIWKSEATEEALNKR